jgi:hypothetical protein
VLFIGHGGRALCRALGRDDIAGLQVLGAQQAASRHLQGLIAVWPCSTPLTVPCVRAPG